jgi:filamentous hemagglutinin family protein
VAKLLQPLTQRLIQPLTFGLNDPKLYKPFAAPVVPAWVPTDLGASLKFWVTAGDHGQAGWTDDGAGLMSAVKDRVGNLSLTAITAERPTWGATSFNSAYPGLAFAGAQRLITTSLGTLPTGAVPGSVFMVVSQDFTPGGAGTHYLMAYGGGAPAVDRGLTRVLATSSRFRVSDGTTVSSEAVAVFDGAHIVSGSWAAAAETGRYDGADISQGPVAITLATGTARLALGARNGAAIGSGATINVSDMIITTTLTLLEHQKLEGWAAWSKGLVARLPAGHPYKSAAP